MKIPKSLNIGFTTILILVYCIPSVGQKLVPKERPLEPDHTITSNIMGKEYQLYISFPARYSIEDTITYPVLYVLDGTYFYSTFNQINRRLSSRGLIEDVILVCIGFGNDRNNWFIGRNFDYTTSVDTVEDRKTEIEFDFPKGTLNSGGASAFLKCIKTEIAPFIDKHYKTNTDRGISGHSFGGLFSAYCFLNSDGYFTRFGISSPSFWWDSEKLLDQAILEFTTNETWDIPPTKVFVSVGKDEGPRMISTMVKFSSYLEDVDYKNVSLNWQMFDHEEHLTVIPANSGRTLSVLYGKN